MIIKFPRHKFVSCKDGCDGCFFCLGGLALCETCGGAEASLPKECPQERMTELQCSEVQDGILNFRDGQWVYEIAEWRKHVGS